MIFITSSSLKKINEILPKTMAKIAKKYEQNPRMIFKLWPDIIGKKLAIHTKIVKFENGILEIKVTNATLYSILEKYDKPKILEKLQKRFSKRLIKNVYFKIG